MTTEIITQIDNLSIDNIISSFSFKVFSFPHYNRLEYRGYITLLFQEHNGKYCFYDVETLTVLSKLEWFLSLLKDHSEANLKKKISEIQSLQEFEIQCAPGTKAISREHILSMYFQLKRELAGDNSIFDVVHENADTEQNQPYLSELDQNANEFLATFKPDGMKMFSTYDNSIMIVKTKDRKARPEQGLPTEFLLLIREKGMETLLPAKKTVSLVLQKNDSPTLLIIQDLALSFKNKSYESDHDIALIINPSQTMAFLFDSYESVIFSHPVSAMKDVIFLSLLFMQQSGFTSGFDLVESSLYYEIYLHNAEDLAREKRSNISTSLLRYHRNAVLTAAKHPNVEEFSVTLQKISMTQTYPNGGALRLLKNVQFVQAFLELLTKEMYYNLTWIPDVAR